jgi:hypothetical protein
MGFSYSKVFSIEQHENHSYTNKVCKPTGIHVVLHGQECEYWAKPRSQKYLTTTK